jgi:hypothetical protein
MPFSSENALFGETRSGAFTVILMPALLEALRLAHAAARRTRERGTMAPRAALAKLPERHSEIPS